MMKLALISVVIFAAVVQANAAGKRPNIVFLLTDDQDTRLGISDEYTELGSVAAMPALQQIMLAEGMRMSNGMVATPICCPSRTETFSGRYYHNIGPPKETGSCMHVNTTHAVAPGQGMFSLLKDAGYQTGAFGKITNDQTNILALATKYKTITYIDSPIDYNNFMGVTYYHLYPNGTDITETISDTDPIFGTPYQTTQIGNRSLRWLDEVLLKEDPIFLYLGPHAPHYPAQPAPWYGHLWDNSSAPRLPNYNASSPGKSQHVRQNPPLTDQVKCWEDQHFRNRWASLKSVDELLEAVVEKFRAAGELDNTYIFYTSDHGYKLGSWRVGTSKQHPYETDIHVPFYVRGPGIKGGSVRPEMVSNVDLLPTMLELAGAEIPDFADGRSLVPLLHGDNIAAPEASSAWRQHLLIEYLSVGTYFNDHSSIWQDGDETSRRCNCSGPPVGPDPATKGSMCKEANETGMGNCYFLDSVHSNNWRLLRIMNETDNLAYIEYDPAWKFEPNTQFQWYELYDLDKDPYQLANIYQEAEPEKRAALAAMAHETWKCSGSSCP